MKRSSSVLFRGLFYKKIFKVVYNYQYHIQTIFLCLLHEFVITKLISVSLSVLHTTFKYYEHFSLPAVTTPNYICYISLNRLAVLFAALLYDCCPHLTSCSEVTIVISGEASRQKPTIVTIQFIPHISINFHLTRRTGYVSGK